MKIWKGVQKHMEKMILPINVEENQEDDNIEETPEYINNHYCFSMDGESDSECPVQQCTFKTTDRYKMRLHFRDCHIKDIIQIRMGLCWKRVVKSEEVVWMAFSLSEYGVSVAVGDVLVYEMYSSRKVVHVRMA